MPSCRYTKYESVNLWCYTNWWNINNENHTGDRISIAECRILDACMIGKKEEIDHTGDGCMLRVKRDAGILGCGKWRHIAGVHWFSFI